MSAKILEFKPRKPANEPQKALYAATLVAPLIGHFVLGYTWAIVAAGCILAVLAILKLKL